jgi:hypothetical protein
MPVVTATPEQLCIKCKKTLLSLSVDSRLAYHEENGNLERHKVKLNTTDPQTWFLWDETNEFREDLINTPAQLISSVRKCLLCSLVFAGLCKSWRQFWAFPDSSDVTPEIFAECIKELGDNPITLVPSRGTDWFPWPKEWNKQFTPVAIRTLDLIRCNITHQPLRDKDWQGSIQVCAEYGKLLEIPINHQLSVCYMKILSQLAKALSLVVSHSKVQIHRSVLNLFNNALRVVTITIRNVKDGKRKSFLSPPVDSQLGCSTLVLAKDMTICD